jgi:putative transposase
MQPDFRQILALQTTTAHAPYVRLPEKARVKDLGIDYCVLHCDRNGVVLRRMDETNATISFTQQELNDRLNRHGNPMTVEYDYYGSSKADARRSGSSSLSALPAPDQEDILRKEFFIRKFLELRSEYLENKRLARISGSPVPLPVSKSRESLLRILPTISLAWRDLQVRNKGGKALTYRTKANIALFEPKPSTVKGWIFEMEKNNFDPICLRNAYRSDREEYFTADEFLHLNNAIRAACSLTKPDIAQIHRDMERVMTAENKMRGPDNQLRIPCVETLRNRFNAMPEMWRDLGREGKAAARNEWQPEHGGIDVIRPLERVECDDHETDLQTLLVKIGIWKTMSKAERKKVKRIRLTITAMICVATRCIVALHVSAEPPSLKSAMTALEMSTRDKSEIARRLGCHTPWPQGGTSETVAVDSAVYFAHRPYRVALNDLGTEIFLPPAGAASWRGFIERWFQTFAHQMFNYFDGRTWSSIGEKGDYDSEACAAMVADLVAECMIRWCVDAYHNAPHSQLNESTPLNRWYELARDHGVQPGPTGALRTHCFGTYVTRKASKKGLRIAGLYFQSRELQQIRRQNSKNPIVGRVNNHNLGAISVLTPQGWIEVPCVHKELEGVSIWRWLATAERLKLYNRENAKVSRQTLLDTFAWLMQQGDMARLEAGLVNPVLTDEDYVRFEKRMDGVFDIVDAPIKGEPRPAGEWHPSNELFEALRIEPIVYAKTRTKKEIREEAETGGRPSLGAVSIATPIAQSASKEETSVVHRISNDIFDDE